MREKMILWFIKGVWTAFKTGKENARSRAATGMLRAYFVKEGDKMGKKWWASKTMILAAVQMAGGILAAYMTQNPTWAYGATAKSTLDIILRLTTDKPVTK